MDSPNYHIQPLNLAKHRPAEFSCEEPELTEFLQNRSFAEMSARASACFVLVPENDRGRILGFYTLSAATVSLAKLPSEMTAQLPQYPNLPATLLGRLARDANWRGKGLGGLLLSSALRRALAAASDVGSIAVVTDPKNTNAAAFYRKYGFQELGSGKRLFLSMANIAASFGGVNPA